MNPDIKAVIGEADMHSPTEREVLDRENAGATKTLKLSGNMRTIPIDRTTGEAEVSDETDMDSPEESKEVQLAKEILSACQAGDKETVLRAARELIQMHEPQAAGGHVQPVPHPKPPRALDYGPHSGGV